MRDELVTASLMEAAQAAEQLEAKRQQQLLAALWQRAETAPEIGLRALPGPRQMASTCNGLAAYRRNAWAGAHRALSLAYPVLEALVGEQSLGALARTLWLSNPPVHGDLAEWGEQVPSWLESQPDTSEYPYLPDLARLEWALHQAGRATDPQEGPPAGLELLADTDPAQLFTRWQPGLTMLTSDWPVFSLWQAHQPEPMLVAHEPERLALVREAIATHSSETVLVWRPQWQVQCQLMPQDWAAFSRSLLEGASLGSALEAHPLDFQDWLLASLRGGWLQAWYSR